MNACDLCNYFVLNRGKKKGGLLTSLTLALGIWVLAKPGFELVTQIPWEIWKATHTEIKLGSFCYWRRLYNSEILIPPTEDSPELEFVTCNNMKWPSKHDFLSQTSMKWPSWAMNWVWESSQGELETTNPCFVVCAQWTQKCLQGRSWLCPVHKLFLIGFM